MCMRESTVQQLLKKLTKHDDIYFVQELSSLEVFEAAGSVSKQSVLITSQDKPVLIKHEDIARVDLPHIGKTNAVQNLHSLKNNSEHITTTTWN